jgi:hypothetical protein
VGVNAWGDTKLTFYSNDFSAANSLSLISVSASANQTLELANDNDAFGNYVRQTTGDRARDVWMDVSSLLSASFADYSDYTIEWSSSDTNLFTVSGNGDKATLSYVDNASGEGTLTATLKKSDGTELAKATAVVYVFRYEMVSLGILQPEPFPSEYATAAV